MPKTFLMLASVGALTISPLVPAVAQVTYAPSAQPFFGFFNQPYDESYDTHPSYQIVPNAYDDGQPAVRVIQRCAYIDGWNAGDFSRDVNGVPLGVEHTCSDGSSTARVRARY